MMTTNKNKTIIYVMIVLLIINSVFTSILWFKTTRKPDLPPKHSGGKFLMDQLNFDSSQRIQFNAIKTDYFNRMDELVDKEHQLKDDFFSSLKSDDITDSMLLYKAKLASTLKVQIDTMMMNHFLKIKSICNKEQLEALYKFFDQFIRQPLPFPARRSFSNKQDSLEASQQPVNKYAPENRHSHRPPMNPDNFRDEHDMPPPEVMDEFNRENNPDFHRPPHPRPPRRGHDKGLREDFPDGPPPQGPPPIQ